VPKSKLKRVLVAAGNNEDLTRLMRLTSNSGVCKIYKAENGSDLIQQIIYVGPDIVVTRDDLKTILGSVAVRSALDTKRSTNTFDAIVLGIKKPSNLPQDVFYVDITEVNWEEEVRNILKDLLQS
jgi:hypothetical protein